MLSIDLGQKLGSGAKSNERVLVITDSYLIKIDPKKGKVMEQEPLSVINGCSVFDQSGSNIGKITQYLII